MKAVTIYLNDEDNELIRRHIFERQMNGESISINRLITEALKPFINSLKNGNNKSSPSEIEQMPVSEDNEQNEQSAPTEEKSLFSDLNF